MSVHASHRIGDRIDLLQFAIVSSMLSGLYTSGEFLGSASHLCMKDWGLQMHATISNFSGDAYLDSHACLARAVLTEPPFKWKVWRFNTAKPIQTVPIRSQVLGLPPWPAIPTPDLWILFERIHTSVSSINHLSLILTGPLGILITALGKFIYFISPLITKCLVITTNNSVWKSSGWGIGNTLEKALRWTCVVKRTASNLS